MNKSKLSNSHFVSRLYPFNQDDCIFIDKMMADNDYFKKELVNLSCQTRILKRNYWIAIGVIPVVLIIGIAIGNNQATDKWKKNLCLVANESSHHYQKCLDSNQIIQD